MPGRHRCLPAAGTDVNSRYRYLVLGILVFVYTLNFVDRVVLGVLVPPIKAELQLTDTQLGLLGGTAFALFYTALGIPIGWLADRFNRIWIVKLAVREPQRGALDGQRQATAAPAFGSVWRLLLRKPAFWYLSFGGASSS